MYKEIDMKKVDWPEALFDSWMLFEQVHGDLEQMQECLDKIDRVQAQVNAKRATDAVKAAYEASQAMAQLQAVPSVVQQDGSTLDASTDVGNAMEVEQMGAIDSKKRKYEARNDEASEAKKPKST